jgi:hypothetical protein
LSKLNSILQDFKPVTLEEVSGVKLMNRIDRKYWFPSTHLEYLLEQLIPLYDVLEVCNKRMVGYQTIYFDTPDNEMYLHHHNGFRDRYKIRRRKYETSEHGYFEIKKKTNKQRTIKKRIETPFQNGGLTEAEYQFLLQLTPYSNLNPKPVMYNRFNRISLVNKKKTERCTLDIQLTVNNDKELVSLNDLAIIELKRGDILSSSPLIYLIKELQIRQKGLSKYCTGMALLEPELKTNNFKPRLSYLGRNLKKDHELCFI